MAKIHVMNADGISTQKLTCCRASASAAPSFASARLPRTRASSDWRRLIDDVLPRKKLDDDDVNAAAPEGDDWAAVALPGVGRHK